MYGTYPFEAWSNCGAEYTFYLKSPVTDCHFCLKWSLAPMTLRFLTGLKKFHIVEMVLNLSLCKHRKNC